LVLNGGGFGLLANHSMVAASCVAIAPKAAPLQKTDILDASLPGETR